MTARAGPPPVREPALRAQVGDLLSRSAIWVGVVIAVIVFALISPRFLTLPNLLTIANNAAVVGIIALGMTLVMVSGGIDLSVGGIVTMTTVVLGSAVVAAGLPFFVALPLALAGSAALGAINGLVVTALRVPPIIATLGMMSILSSLAVLATQGATISLRQVEVLRWLGQGRIAGVPVPVLALVLATLATHVVLSRTVFGDRLKAVGGSPSAAAFMGVPVCRTRIAVYAMSGLIAGLAALIVAGRLSAASSTAGDGMEFAAVSAAVLGGTSLAGGRGSAMGTVGGALFLSVMLNGLILVGVPFFFQLIVTGVALVTALCIQGRSADP